MAIATTSAAVRPVRRTMLIATAVMTVALIVAPLLGVYPVFLMKALCFALFACAFNLLIGFGGLLSFGHAMFLGTAGYVCAHAAKEWGWPPEFAILGGTLAAAAMGVRRRPAGDPAAGHLFRDDHAGARADGVFLLPAGAVHARRGRHPGGAARQAVRRARPVQHAGHVLRRAGDLPRGVPAHLPDRAFAVRPGAEGDPRERAARDFAGLRRRKLQVPGLRAVRHARGTGRRDQGDRVPAGIADRRALDDVGRSGADDAAGRHGHDLRTGGRRIHDHRPRELSGGLRAVGDGDHRRHLRGLRARVPARHRRRARGMVGAAPG